MQSEYFICYNGKTKRNVFPRDVYFSTMYAHVTVLFVYFNHHGDRISFNKTLPTFVLCFAPLACLPRNRPRRINALVETTVAPHVCVRGVFTSRLPLSFAETEDEVDRLRHYALDFCHDD